MNTAVRQAYLQKLRDQEIKFPERWIFIDEEDNISG